MLHGNSGLDCGGQNKNTTQRLVKLVRGIQFQVSNDKREHGVLPLICDSGKIQWRLHWGVLISLKFSHFFNVQKTVSLSATESEV